MLVWQVLFSLLMMTVVKCFLTDILRLFGATDELMPGAVRYSRILIYGNLAYMLVTGVLAVIRNDGRPVLSMWLMVGGLLLNIVMDYVFIFPLGGGVAGAAYATVTAQMLIAVAGLAYFFTRKTALRFDLQMFKLEAEVFENIVVSGFPSLGNQLSIIAMLFFHNYQALKYGRVDGLAAYTFIGAVESLGSLFDDRAGTRGAAAGRLSLRRRPSPPAEHYRQHGLLYRFRIGNCADVRIGCRTRRFSRLVQFARQCGGSCRTRTGYQFDGVRAAGRIRVAGYYYQATGKITDSSLLIYGDAFVALPLCLFARRCGSVWTARMAGNAGFRVLLFLFVCYLWFGRKNAGRTKCSIFLPAGKIPRSPAIRN